MFQDYNLSIINNFNEIINLVKGYSKILIITDDNIKNHYNDIINEKLIQINNSFIYTIEAGEPSKSIYLKKEIEDFMFSKNFDRKACLIALGGGVVGDLTGYIASTYMRGIDYIQIPTTLLAMVDSSIGGKTGIDNKWGKNLIGSFYLPKKIIIDEKFLKTLPEEEFINGMAEIIKIAIVANKELWNLLLDNDLITIKTIIKQIIDLSIKTKLDIINSDFKEGYNRQILNFGHTLGHAIESITYEKHGYCVAQGICYELLYQDDNGYIVPFFLQNQIKNCLFKYGLPIKLDKCLKEKSVLKYLKQDKKANKMVLIKDICQPIIIEFDKDKLAQTLENKVEIISSLNKINLNEIKMDAPSSKSETNRVIPLAVLGKGNIVIKNILISDDTIYMINAFKKLGVKIDLIEETTLLVEGTGGNFNYSDNTEIFLGNSGTCMRFLTSILGILGKNKIKLTGDKYMLKRPIHDLVNALNNAGINITCNNGYPPVIINGGNLQNNINIKSDSSSQYLSGLLMTLPFINKRHIITEGNIVSYKFIELTKHIMTKFNVIIEEKNNIFKTINTKYTNPETYTIEADASSASYLLGLTVLFKKNIVINNLTLNNTQGDLQYNSMALREFGYFMNVSNVNTKASSFFNIKNLRILNMDSSDTFLTWVVVACFINGTTKIINIDNQNIKECKRIDVIYYHLKKAGVNIERNGNDLTIIGGLASMYNGIYVDCFNDHRIAMSMTLFGAMVPGIVLSNYQCVNKTYYNFWNDIKKFGITITKNKSIPIENNDNCIILIGMTKAGKSTLGEYLYDTMLDYEFIDTDLLIEKHYKKQIINIINDEGLEYFRKIESVILNNILFECQNKKVIISTGGGIIESEINRNLLKKFSKIIHIQRDISIIDKLVDKQIWVNGIKNIWKYRKPIYNNLSTYKFINFGNKNSKKYFVRWINNILKPPKINDISFFVCLNVGSIKVEDKLDNDNNLIPNLNYISKGADAIELRYDLLDDNVNIDEQIHLLGENCTIPIIFTCRSFEEGGEYKGNNQYKIIENAIYNGVPIIDIELRIKESINKKHALTIGSCHYETWNYMELNLRKGLYNHDIDIIKLVGPNDLLQRTKVFINNYSNKKNIIISKRDEGKQSRVNNLFLTPVTHDLLNVTAEGQMTIEEILTIRKILYNKKYYLIGNNIQYSPSPFIHNYVFRKLNIVDEYELYDTSHEKEINNVIRMPNFGGASITCPYKELIIKYLDELTYDAKNIKAVNTIYKKNNKLIGDNTDWKALFDIINNNKYNSHINNNLLGCIIGSGGVARAGCYAFQKSNIKFDIYSRNIKKGAELIKEFNGSKYYNINSDIKNEYNFVIICIPSNVKFSLEKFNKKCLIIDMGYNSKRDNIDINGYTILYKQAELQYECWHNKRTNLYKSALDTYLKIN